MAAVLFAKQKSCQNIVIYTQNCVNATNPKYIFINLIPLM